MATRLVLAAAFSNGSLFLVSVFAETNRPLFDLPEAEAELVAGYQVEYTSTPYLLFMIGELSAVLLMTALMTILFFDGLFFFMPDCFFGCLQRCYLFFIFSLIKGLVPRFRYDN